MVLACVWAMLLMSLPLAAEKDAEEGWSPLPEGTTGVLFVTGGDRGYIKPMGCLGIVGGARYRPAFNDWLAAEEPELDWKWVSTGPLTMEPARDHAAADPEEMLEHLANVGYSLVSTTLVDAEVLGLDRISQWSERGLPFASANLVVFETGETAMPAHGIVEVDGVRLGVVPVTGMDREWLATGPRGGSVVTEEPLQAIDRAFRELRGSVDQLVLVSSGMADLRLRQLLRGMELRPDLVLARMSAHTFVEPKQVEGVPVLWMGMWGRMLGRVSFDADGEILEIRNIKVDESFPIDTLTGEPRPKQQAEGQLTSLD